MNLVYLHCHDLGRYLGCYGREVESPHLDALAEGSILFENAFCANPTCSPSRCSLLTGQYPHNCGMFGLTHLGFRLERADRHLVRVLGDRGWHTALCGIQHEFPAKEIPYRTIIPSRGAEFGTPDWDAAIAEASAGFLERPPDEPFVLSCGFFYPHRPLMRGGRPPHPPLPRRMALPDDPSIREDYHGFLKSVRHMDACAGKVLDAIENSGLAENTIVVFTTDHGAPYPGNKSDLRDAGLEVALMLRAPGREPGRVTAMVSQVDLYPTLLEMLGLDCPEATDGVSLTALINGGTASVRDHLFAEVNHHAEYQPMRALRTREFKYIRSFESDLRHRTKNYDGFKDFGNALQANGYLDEPRPRERLFDIKEDPDEQSNRIGDRACAVVEDKLRTTLDDWMRTTDDPLLGETGTVDT